VSRRSAGPIAPLLLALALSGLVAATALATTPVGRTYVASDCEGAAFKPRSIILTCGDAGLVANKLQWTQWGAKRAHGAGLGEEKVCTPNCAEGRVAKGAMKVTLSRPRLCSQDGKRHFTKIHYSWPAGAPGEGPDQGNIPLPCSILSNY
jgi:hypothetical protein